MLYIVPKTFYRENCKNKAMTASAYGHNFCSKIAQIRIGKFLLCL